MYQLLTGARVLELGHILMAPYATQFLGDFGADMIKVEPLEGDYYRQLGLELSDKMSAQWVACNRNKRSLAIDLTSPEGCEAFHALLRTADIFVHNMRPEAIKGLGLDYESVRIISPKTVYCAAIGYGQEGRYASEPAFDDLIQAGSGITALNGLQRGRPAFVPMSLVDMMVGQMLAISMLSGLHHQRRTGEGCYIETPMFEAAVAVVMNQHLNGHTTELPSAPLGYARVMSTYREPVPTKDGFIVHGVYKYEQWRVFLDAVDREDILASDMMRDQKAMAAHISQLYQVLWQEIMPTRTTAEWKVLLKGSGIPSVAALQIDQLQHDPHLQDVGLFETYEHPDLGSIRQVRSPFRVHNVQKAANIPPPTLGKDTIEVLSELGFDRDRMDALARLGVISDITSR